MNTELPLEKLSKPRKQNTLSPSSEGNRPHLSILGTHFDYSRRGFAASLVQWGIDLADAQGLELSLKGALIGYPLYRKLG